MELGERGGGVRVRWPVGLVAVLLYVGTAAVAGAGDLKDVIADLYGGDGIRLSQSSGFGHDAHFTTSSLEGLDRLSSAIASGIGNFSFSSAISGYALDLETGVPVRLTDSLGPLLAERASTLGKNRINLGFTCNVVHCDRFEGAD